MDKGEQAKPSGHAPAKRTYATPRLTEYGSVAKLTQGSASLQSDGGGGGGFKKAACL